VVLQAVHLFAPQLCLEDVAGEDDLPAHPGPPSFRPHSQELPQLAVY
jgi:hypothetical protein